ncbi:MAG TPA: GerMN domain-containing protein [Egibacteraceae bacterium]|nr:GerMN domain-containing protein [Egibacteraceae bacterium]
MRGLLLALLALLTVACTALPDGSAAGPDSSPAAGTVSAEPTMQPDDVVDLTVYFRRGEGEGAHLVPVTRETSIDGDLPLTALELLLAGPAEEDGRDLTAPLPTSTEVRSLRIEDGTAHVDLSHQVITAAESANPSPEHEALALAALVGTLCELPAIEQVRLSVEGAQAGLRSGVDVGAFWGGWGLPKVLVPDDSVMSEPAEGEGVPDLARFGGHNQEIGAPTDEGVAITSVRIRDRTTYLRVVVELEHAEDADTSPAVPPARAHRAGNDLVLEIDDIAHYDADFAPGQRLEFDDPPFAGVRVDQTERDGLVRIVVLPDQPRDFWLHTLSSPTRIVLDVRK